MASYRVDLYGIRLELPGDWQDLTSYSFRGAAPLASIAFNQADIPPSSTDEWLSRTQAELAGFDGARVGTVRRFENASLSIQGFECRFGSHSPGQYRSFLIASRSTDCITISAKGSDGYADIQERIVGSLRVAPPTEAPNAFGVYDLSFVSPVELAPPTQFSFASSNGRSRMTAEWVDTRPEWTEPRWPADPSEDVRVVDRIVTITSGRKVSSPGGRRPVDFEERRVLGALGDGAGDREMVYAEARTKIGERFVYLRFESEERFSPALATWQAVLQSALREL